MEHITKNSGNNKTGESWMIREVKLWKPRYDLIPLDQLKRLAELYSRWAEIYWDRNWEKWRWEDLDMFKQSAFRHFIQWQNWEDDEDHASAVIWNIMWYEHCKNEELNGFKRYDKSNPPIDDKWNIVSEEDFESIIKEHF